MRTFAVFQEVGKSAVSVVCTILRTPLILVGRSRYWLDTLLIPALCRRGQHVVTHSTARQRRALPTAMSLVPFSDPTARRYRVTLCTQRPREGLAEMGGLRRRPCHSSLMDDRCCTCTGIWSDVSAIRRAIAS